jgi:toxin ParE1/3/4
MPQRIVWTEPAKIRIKDILSFIAFDNRDAALRLGERILDGIDRLMEFPKSGRKLPELPRAPFRELVIRPCRVIHLVQESQIIILTILRTEQLLKPELWEH